MSDEMQGEIAELHRREKERQYWLAKHQALHNGLLWHIALCGLAVLLVGALLVLVFSL